MSERTFVDACLAGDALLEDVDDWVGRWHDSNGRPGGHEAPLDSYLGFDEAEGNLWAERPEALRFVVAAHRYARDVNEIVSAQDEFALAARSGAEDDAKAVLTWLRQAGRI